MIYTIAILALVVLTLSHKVDAKRREQPPSRKPSRPVSNPNRGRPGPTPKGRGKAGPL